MSGGFASPAPRAPEQQMRPFDDAYCELLESFHALVATLDLQQQSAAAFSQYTQIIQAGSVGPADMQRLACDACARYLETLQCTISSGGTRAAAGEVFRNYVRALKDAWATVNPDSIDPPVLAAIGQTLTAAGWAAMGLSPLPSRAPTPASP